MLVHRRNWAEVAGFAARNGFELSPNALKALSEEKAVNAGARVYKPEAAGAYGPDKAE